MIKVFSMKAKLSSNGILLQDASAFVVVSADKPNIVAAISRGREIAEENIAGDYNVSLASMKLAGLELSVYPLDGGCGIPLQAFLQSHTQDDIINWDDIVDAEWEYEDFGYHTQRDILGNLRDRAESYWLDWDCEKDIWAEKMLEEKGIEIDIDKCFFSIGYVQGDYGECDWECKDIKKLLGDDYEKQFKQLSKRLLYRYAVDKGNIYISVSNAHYYGVSASVGIDFPDYYEEHTNKFWELVDDLEEDIVLYVEEIAKDINRKLYLDMRDILEQCNSDESVVEYINQCAIRFDMDGNTI